MRLLAALLLALTALPAAVWWHDAGPLGPAFYVESPEGEFAFALPEDAQGTPTRRGLAGDTGWVSLPDGRALGLSWDGGPTWIRLEVAGDILRQCAVRCRFGEEGEWVEAPLPRAGLLPLGLMESALVAVGRDALWLLPPGGSGSVRSLSEAEVAARAWLAAGEELILAPTPPAPTEGGWFPWGMEVEVAEGAAGVAAGISVLGAVERPGPQRSGEPATIAAALAASGLLPGADLSRVEARLADGSWHTLNIFAALTAPGPLPGTLPHDAVLLVPAGPSPSTLVLGGGFASGLIPWTEGMSVADALLAAGEEAAAAAAAGLTLLGPDGSRQAIGPGRFAQTPLALGVVLEAGRVSAGPPAAAWRALLDAVFTPGQVAALMGG